MENNIKLRKLSEVRFNALSRDEKLGLTRISENNKVMREILASVGPHDRIDDYNEDQLFSLAQSVYILGCYLKAPVKSKIQKSQGNGTAK